MKIRFVTGCIDHHDQDSSCPFWHEINGESFCIMIQSRFANGDDLNFRKTFPDCPLLKEDILVKLVQ